MSGPTEGGDPALVSALEHLARVIEERDKVRTERDRAEAGVVRLLAERDSAIEALESVQFIVEQHRASSVRSASIEAPGDLAAGSIEVIPSREAGRSDLPTSVPGRSAGHHPAEVCDDCAAGNHEPCSREGGYLDDEDNSIRCDCHLNYHPTEVSR